MSGKANMCLPYGLACCMIEPWTTRATETPSIPASTISDQADEAPLLSSLAAGVYEAEEQAPYLLDHFLLRQHAWGSAPGYGQAVH
jgi:hypothetical protein